MAAATKQQKQREVVTTVTEEVYTLELRQDEAEFLYRLLGHHIAGPKDGPRGISSRIYAALDGAANFDDLPELNVSGISNRLYLV